MKCASTNYETLSEIRNLALLLMNERLIMDIMQCFLVKFAKLMQWSKVSNSKAL